MTPERWAYIVVVVLVVIAVMVFAWAVEHYGKPPAGKHRRIPPEEEQ